MNNDHGSLKPLCWKAPVIKSFEDPRLTVAEVVEKHARHGTPITTRGAVNGVMPPLKPNTSIPENPRLVVKGQGIESRGGHIVAYTQAGRPVYESQRPTTKRPEQKKEDENSQQNQQPQQATEQEEEEREDANKSTTLRALSILKKGFQLPSIPMRTEQGGTPVQLAQTKTPGFGVSGGPPQQSSQGKVIGSSPSGQPIYDDPFHSAHQNFGKDDHTAAANLHEQLAATSPDSAQQHMSAAQAHRQMIDDNRSPMDRAAQKFGNGMIPQNQPAGGRQPLPGQPQQGMMPQQAAPLQGQPPSMPPVQPRPQINVPQGAPIGMPSPGMGLSPRAPNAPVSAQPGMPPKLVGQQQNLNSPNAMASLLPGVQSGKPPMGTPQGEPPMGVQPPHGTPPAPPAPQAPPVTPTSSTNNASPFQNKPLTPPQLDGGPRMGPLPGMQQRLPPPGVGVTGNPQMPNPGSATVQQPMGMPLPPKQTGAGAPPTSPGFQGTPVDRLPPKPRPSTLQTQQQPAQGQPGQSAAQPNPQGQPGQSSGEDPMHQFMKMV